MGIQLGFDCFEGEGPGIFLTRLKAVLEARGQFAYEAPDVWVQLSYKPLPDFIQARKHAGITKILLRMDGAYCNRYTKIKVPFQIPCWPLDKPYSRKINDQKNATIKNNLLAADGIVFQSRFCHALTQRFVAATPPGVTIYNGVDLTRFTPGSLQKSSDSERLKILISHSFRPHHRLHDAMRILAALIQVRPDAQFTILGGGDDASFQEARRVASSLGLQEGAEGNYVFLGKYPSDALVSVYQVHHGMLNLSYWDSCPNVVIEAMACGLPVVGVNYGGVAELVGDAGVLIDESIPFRELYHQDFRRMPKAPVAAYVEGLLEVAGQLPKYQLAMRNRAVSCFDVERAADQYISAAQGLVKIPSPLAGEG